MKKTFACILAGILCVFCSCMEPQKYSEGQSGDFSFTVALKNNTPFDLEILDDTRIIPGYGEKRITLPSYFGELNDGYRVNYRVRLLDEVFIKVPRKENIIIKPDQKNVIIETADFQSDSCFLVLQNDERQTVSLKTDNAYLLALIQGEPREYGPTPYLGPGKSYVYEIKPGINDIVLERDQYRALPLPSFKAMPGYIYAFLFKGNEIALTNARPLQRVGESGWAKTVPITTASASTPLLAYDGTIQLFAPVNNGVTRYAYDSGGNKKAEVKNGDNFQITSAIQAADGYFISGYEKRGDRFLPVARMHNADGVMRRLLAPSNRPEYYSAFFKAAAQTAAQIAAQNAAQKDDWLAAGGAKAIGDDDFFAYVRLAKDNGSALAASWELGKKEFNEALQITDRSPLSAARCGEVRCAAYDPVRNRWLLSGENIEYDSMFSSVTGSYLAVIGNDGYIDQPYLIARVNARGKLL